MRSLYSYEKEPLQIEACLSFIKSLNSYYTKSIPVNPIDEYTLGNAYELIEYSLSVFDRYLADDIRVHGGDFPPFTDDAAGYFRSDSFKYNLPKSIIKRLGVDTDKEYYIYLGYNEHIRFYSEIHEFSLVPLFPEISALICYDTKPEPICSLPRQDIYTELLKCGINPLGISTDTTVGFSRSKHLSRMPQSSPFTRRIANLKKIYQDHLKREVLVVPTASGTSANEACIWSVKEAANSDLRAYIHPYWYYENKTAINQFSGVKTDHYENSNIAFINIEPTNFLNLKYTVKQPTVREIISNYLYRASKNADQNYYLIIDLTVDPFFKSEELNMFMNLSNTYVLITISLTKHQLGDRRYFFGVIILPGNSSSLLSVITRYIPKVGGRMSDRHKRYYPEINKQWISIKRIKVSKINQTISKMARSSQWWIDPYTFNAIVYPEVVLVDDIYKTLTEYHANEVDSFLTEFNSKILDITRNTVISFGSKKIEFGDSFGLDIARVTVQGGDTIIRDRTFKIKLPRISPGYNSSKQELLEFSDNLIKNLSEYSFNINERQ